MSQRQHRFGKCALCTEERVLSEDHIPPRSAFNDCQSFLLKVEEASADHGELRWRRERSSQRGVVYDSLCADCNNRLGRYNRAYVDLAKSIAEKGRLEPEDTLPVSNVQYPLRVRDDGS